MSKECVFCGGIMYDDKNGTSCCINCCFRGRENEAVLIHKNDCFLIARVGHELENMVKEYGKEKVRAVFQPSKDDVVVDVGAHLGEYAIPAALKCRQVIAFEPNAEVFALLDRAIAINGLTNITLVNAALGSQEAESKLYVPGSHTGMSSMLYEDGNAQSVKMITLDAYLDRSQKKVDWLKVDVEGYEFHVLQGAIRTLERNRDSINIIVECHTPKSKEQVQQFLEGIGLQCEMLDRIHLYASSGAKTSS